MKKGQSLLVFFGVQLVCIIMFIIVLLTVLTMSKSVSFRIQQFDEATNHILVTRWLLSSPDCLAYQDKNIFIDNEQIYFMERTYPYILDVNKVRDYEHINCIRMDHYDIRADASKGVLDAKEGAGIGLKYDVIVFDLSGDEPKVLTGPRAEKYGVSFNIDRNITDYTTTSLLSRVFKQPNDWWRFVGVGHFVKCAETQWLNSRNTMGWRNYEEECVNWRIDYGQFDHNLVRYSLDGFSSPDKRYQPDFVFGNPSDSEHKYDKWATVIAKTNETEDGLKMTLSIWHHQNITCFEEQARREFFPVLLYEDGDFKHGAVLIQTCLLEGDSYKGLDRLDFEYKGRLRR